MTATPRQISSGFSSYNTIDIAAIRIELTTGEVIEYRDQFIELEIYRSVFAKGMTGSIIIKDILGTVNNGPILGGERVYLRFKSPAYEEYTELFMRVSMVTESVPISQSEPIVKLELCGEALYFGMAKQISRGFRGQYSEIARQFWAETGIDVPIQTDDSLGIFTLTTTTTRNAIDTLRWMAHRARTGDRLPFTMFEDFEGLNFVSMSRMLAQTNTIKFIHQPQETEEDIRKQWMNILAVDTEANTRDAFNFMERGIGRGREISYSLGLKENIVRRDMFSDVASTFAMNPGPIRVTGEEQTDTTDFYIARTDFSDRNAHERESLAWAMQYNRKVICNHGDDRARLGQIVEVNFYSPQVTDGLRIPDEKFFAGRFLVTSIKDTIRPNEYRTYRGLSQNSLKTEVA